MTRTQKTDGFPVLRGVIDHRDDAGDFLSCALHPCSDGHRFPEEPLAPPV